jgi:16S rRNA (guanine966-N2)-methyltransferase
VRIIGGSAGGRRLAAPPASTRPTTDRVREALFSSLEARIDDWSGVRVLDLFAGSGAIGLEALSRGASDATLVERDRRCLEILRRNAQSIAPGARVIAHDALTWTPDRAFDFVYLDPPYAMPDDDVRALLDSLGRAGALASDALVVVERSTRSESPWPSSGWDGERRRDYGETSLWYGRHTGTTRGEA